MRVFFAKRKRLGRIVYFFPIQLLLVVIKKNQALLAIWCIFFGFITQNIAPKYGIPFLFLNPEYMDNVDFWSYLITGFACGGFIMAFNMANYVMNGFRFPFLATLSNPFFKFCINNGTIPVLFVGTYVFCIYHFQKNIQFVPLMDVWIDIAGFLLGVFIFIFLAVTYFNTVNKDIKKMFGVETDEGDKFIAPSRNPDAKPKTQRVIMRKNLQWNTLNVSRKEQRDWHIETYVSSFSRIKLARGFEHYEKEMLIKVFKQNHLTAAVFAGLAIISLMVLGLFRDIRFFEIPAGASVFLLFTSFIMLSSAIHTFLRGWSTTVSFLLLFLVNQMYTFDFFNAQNRAYGLNYQGKKAEFSNEALLKMDVDSSLKQQDMKHMFSILHKWRAKNIGNSSELHRKPKLVFINTSGGGLRSAFWTFYSLQYADSLLKGQLLKHAFLITGSSGGMVGAAYMREMYMRCMLKKDKGYYGEKLLKNVSKDILNPISFSIAANDLFFRFQHFNVGNHRYVKDRGYAFETKLNENTCGVFKGKIMRDYAMVEREAFVPMMIFSPAVVNDGRKVLISSQPISYLTQNCIGKNVNIHPLVENIEFSRFFAKQGADSLLFTSALRMSATFPYVSPVVSLPSYPIIDVMDAGMRDNYGLEITLNFIYQFQQWIETNTSGVVIIQIRGNGHKEFPVDENEIPSMFGSLTRPINMLYGNMFNIQDFSQNQLVQYASAWFKGKIDFVDFQLQNKVPDNISLSWHLTEKEKKRIRESIKLPENQEAIVHLKKLLE